MKTDTKKATERLHQVLADTSGLTKAELRRQLQQEGVDVNAFLQRLRGLAPAGAETSAPPSVRPAEVEHFLPGSFTELPLAARQAEGRKSKPSD